MSPTELVCAFIGALEAKQWDAANAALTEHFFLRGSGPDPQLIDRHAFLAMHQALQKAAPDWSFQFHIAWARGNVVAGSMQMSGTLTGNYALPPFHNHFMHATGKPLRFPRLRVRFLLHGARIGAMLVERPSGGRTPTVYAADPYLLDRRQQRHALPAPFHIPMVVQAASFPIYGLVGAPMGLTLRSFGYSYAGPVQLQPRPLNAVILTFAYPPQSRTPERSVELVLLDPKAPCLAPFWDWRKVPPNLGIFDEDGERYVRFPTAALACKARDNEAACLIDKCPLVGDVCALRIERWRGPPMEWSFSLYGQAVRITGAARGISRRELVRLLQESEILNERLDVVGQYQAETAAWLGFLRR